MRGSAMKLFMFQIGGDCGGSNVELHDIRFSVGKIASDCYDDLRSQWWGNPKSLHVDCWGEIRHSDGYDIQIVPQRQNSDNNKLFFINLGGYDPAEFGELHHNVLLVCPDAKTAKARALAEIQHWSQPHKDKVFEVEKAVNVSKSVEARGYSIELVPSPAAIPFDFVCKYLKIR
ncbi:DUF1543 domain-containing protein [Brucella pseudogrignonensis]|nr:DUF1543 domain-containing protein [Brucella pseudogrignonensis]